MRYVSCRAALVELEEEEHEVPEVTRLASFPLFDTPCTYIQLKVFRLVMVGHSLILLLLRCLLIGGRW